MQGDAFRRLLASTLNSTKSSNAVVRTNATRVFKAIIGKTTDSADLTLALDELLSLPKAGKTTGPDHRIALYNMLGHLTPSEATSPVLLQTGLPLLAKESHDIAVTALATSLAPHIVFCLRENVALSADVLSLIAKEMNNAKPVLRRAFCSLTGDALWNLGDLSTDASYAFANAMFPALEANLKIVAASPASSLAGPLEAYVATAILLGPIHRSGKFGKSVISRPPKMQRAVF